MKTLWIFLRDGGVWRLSRCLNIHGQRFGLRTAFDIKWGLAGDEANKRGYWSDA